jgi:hypothetical protein
MIMLIVKRILRIKWHRSPYSRNFFKLFFSVLQFLTNRKFAHQTIVDNKFYPIVNRLKKSGFELLSPKTIPLELLHDHGKAVEVALEIASQTDIVQPSLSKQYLHRANLNKANSQSLKILYDYVTNEFFLNIASQYFCEMPLLVELKVLVSPPAPSNNTSLEGSQLWHSDFSDTKLLKIFIFLEEVDSDSGPLELISKQDTKELLSSYNYSWGVVGVSHNDSIVPDNSSKINSMTGDKGSIVLVDTVACLHRGSRNCKKTRKILYATYSSRTSFRHPPWNWLSTSSSPHPYSSPLLEIDPNLDFINEIAINR